MAREIIKARNQSQMYDKLNRAAHIVLCVRGLNDALAAALHLRDGLPPVVAPAGTPPPPAPPAVTTVDGVVSCTRDPAESRSWMQEMGGFLVHTG
jgi:hypothetical protein